MSADLQELLARVEKAEGPDRELDHALDELRDQQTGESFRAPPYTASLDMADLLIRSFGGDWQLSTVGRFDAWVWIDQDPNHTKQANGPTGPLTLLAALLRALISTHSEEGAG